jgi:hypothetical protein
LTSSKVLIGFGNGQFYSRDIALEISTSSKISLLLFDSKMSPLDLISIAICAFNWHKKPIYRQQSGGWKNWRKGQSANEEM